MVNVRSLLVSIVLLTISSFLSAHLVDLRCDPFDIDTKPGLSNSHDFEVDQMRDARSETSDCFYNEHMRDDAIEARRTERGETSVGNYPTPDTPSPKPSIASGKGPSSRSPQSEFNKESVSNIQVGNSTITIRKIPNAIEFSYRSKKLLKSCGLSYIASGMPRTLSNDEDIALYNWMVHVVNCVTELNFDPPTTLFGVVIKQTLILLHVAHTMLMNGKQTVAGDLIKLAITAVCKYDEYSRAYRRAAYSRIGYIFRNPEKFMRETVEGFCCMFVLVAKATGEIVRLQLSEEARRDFYHALTRLPEKSNALAAHIMNMSAQEWDAAFLQASEALGGLSVDLAINAGIGYYVPHLFSEITRKVPLYNSAELPGGMGRLAHAIDMVYDPVSKSYIVEQKAVPAVAKAIGEAVQKGAGSLPATVKVVSPVVSAAEQGKAAAAVSAAVSTVSKVVSSVSEAAAASSGAQKLVPLGLGSTGRAEPLNLIEKLAMEEIMSNPASGKIVELTKGMTDIRWPKNEGWVKMAWNYTKAETKIEIHYVAQYKDGIITAVDDFKFINKNI